jgi:iron complex outermembrane receptor protein
MGLCAGPVPAAGDDAATGYERPAIEEITVYATRLLIGPDASNAAIKSAVLLRDLPMSVEVVGAEIIDSGQYIEFAPVLDAYTLASSTPGERGLFEQIMLRGFTDTPYYRNGINDSVGALPVHELANVEAIEILKGPGSALYGPGEPGGSINFRTKQPQMEAAHSMQAGFGHQGRFRTELDSTGPLDADAGVAYRFIGASENAGSFRDIVTSERRFAAPSISWKPDDKLQVLAAVEFLHHQAPFDSGTVAVDGKFPLPRDRNPGEPDTGDTRIEALTAALDADYRWNPAWSGSVSRYWQETDVDGLRVEPAELDDFDAAAPSAILVRELLHESESSRVLTAQAEVEGEFRTGILQHRLLLGYEYDHLRDRSRLDVSDSEAEPFAIDIFDIQYGGPRPELFPEENARETIRQYAVYVQDFVRLGDHWRLLAGTRLDRASARGHEQVEDRRIDQRDENFSSRVGIVFNPLSALSLFSSYSESLDPNEGLLSTGEPLRPTRGKSVEAGLRIRHPLMDFTFDGAVFDIEQTNVTAEAPGNPGFEIQTARQVSAGLDLDMSLRPLSVLRLGLGYAYTDVQIRDDPEIPDGTTPLNAPRHKLIVYGLVSASLWREQDLHAGFSVAYSSARQGSLDVEELGVRLDGYSTVNLFASFDLTAQVEFGLSISNLLNEDYLAGSQSDLLHVTPGAPRAAYGTLKLRF